MGDLSFFPKRALTRGAPDAGSLGSLEKRSLSVVAGTIAGVLTLVL